MAPKKGSYIVSRKEFHRDPADVLRKSEDRDVAIVDEDGSTVAYFGQVSLDENRWEVQTFDQAAFDRLKSELRHDPNIALSSNLRDTYDHPAYQDIIDAGTIAVPYMLRDLRDSGPQDLFWWFHAIDEIVGPQKAPDVLDHMKGCLPELTDLYIEWGYNQGYLS